LALDLNKVNAQQARRVLDRLVGYKVSPFLWKTLYSGLSAGRVQSVALRLVCERDQEIEVFVPKEYWSITARLKGTRTDPLQSKLAKVGNAKAHIPSQQEADAILASLRGKIFKVKDITKREQKKNPPPPFTTSTLQQEASRRLNFGAKKTMALAQQLYEGVELKDESVGLITYMRTDSTRLAAEAVEAVRTYIANAYGSDYVPSKPRIYVNKKGAQDAHEAVRPTSMERSPDVVKPHLRRDQARLYELVWNRFLACQMKPAVLDVTTIEVQADEYLFVTSGSTVLFPGFMRTYKEVGGGPREDAEPTGPVPVNLDVGEELTLLSLEPAQHFTEPPPRYTEATLVRELEAQGIGRPSTYAQIVSTIQDRGYVTGEARKLISTELGRNVNALLVRMFPDIFNVKFTAWMEDELDRVEAGEDQWVDVVKAFYTPFQEALAHANTQGRALKESLQEETGEVCEKCRSPMLIRWGRRGRFLACSGYPKCRNAKPLQEDHQALGETDEKCEKCGSAMVVKSGRYGNFLACSAYPRCRSTRPIPLGVVCPEADCGGDVVEKRSKKGRLFYGCTKYPNCSFVSWNKPVNKRCPDCGASFLVEKASRSGEATLKCLTCKAGFPVEHIA
jgi:DNA topoisomerase-1